MSPSVLISSLQPYTAVDAWVYDRVIAPAVLDLRAAVEEQLFAALPSGARVLDVGCGGGQLVAHVAERRSDVRVVGLDRSTPQIARARERGNRFGDRVSFAEGSALDMPLGAASFDVVVSVASIKHWPDPARGVAECVRVLRPGGALVILEVDRSCLLDDARAFVRRWRMPAALRPAALVLFRTYVAGQSIDVEEARALLAPFAWAEREVVRVAGTPALMMRGRLEG